MNWKKLEQKFPKSSQEIREHFLKTKIEDGRTLIESFLNSKGYKCGYGFIKQLKEYELKKYIDAVLPSINYISDSRMVIDFHNGIKLLPSWARYEDIKHPVKIQVITNPRKLLK